MGSTRAWTSSGRTWSRPARAAYARAARRRWRLARGDAPKRRAGVERVAVVRSTTYCLMAALACIVRTVSISLAMVSPSVTGAIASRGNAPPWLSSIETSAAGDVAHRDACHETVALRLGQGVGALHLDRVLCGHHDERLVQLIGLAVYGDLALLHALQHRRLGLGGGAVDLVTDDDVGKDGARPELEVA